MKTDQHLTDIIQLCVRKELKAAIDALENYLLTRQRPVAQQQVEQLKATYSMLEQTWLRGVQDPQRDGIYQGLLTDCYRLASSLQNDYRVTETFVLQGMRGDVKAHHGEQWSVADMLLAMEDFVAESSMLELEQPHVREAKEKALYRSHALLMNDVFNHIVTMGPAGVFASDIEALALSDTVSVTDRQLVVSAITLSLLSSFDFQLWNILVGVCLKDGNESLRQRALVGVVLALDIRLVSIYPQITDRLEQLRAQWHDLGEQLAELQMQMVFCLQAEQDTRTMRDELIPEVMRNSQMHVTPKGIEEMEEDSIEDILHPERADERMERMEQTMQRMSDMMRQGSDIYFGGFSQTKRLPFFSAMSNWFVPFYEQHPGISDALQDSHTRKLLLAMMQGGSFCDSDKYSFVLLFRQVAKGLPEQLQKALGEGHATLLEQVGEQLPVTSPAFLRRIYLQNLYRFFRLHPYRADFSSPFSDDRYLFLVNSQLSGLLSEEECCQTAAFLINHHRSPDALHLLMSRSGSSVRYFLLCARLAVLPEAAHYQLSQEEQYDAVLAIEPDNTKALSGKARCLFNRREYEQAASHYERLTSLQPEKMSYQLNVAACQANMGHYEKALRTLFRLNYEYPDSADVTRVLAWTLMAANRYDEALNHYQHLDNEAADLLNRGYCLWMSGRVAEAADMVRKSSLPIAAEDEEMLLTHGISPTEIALMRENYCIPQ